MKKLIYVLVAVPLITIFLSTDVFAADVTIKDVPAGAEDKVKEMAMVAIERHLRAQVQANSAGMGDNAYIFADQKAVDDYKKSIDDILVANGLSKKFK